MSYKYNAFISYRHADKDIEIAEHIQDALEQFHIPRSVRKERDLKGSLRIFRDKNDLPVTDSLNDTIGTALRESEYLIVICSSHTRESVWVEKEIELFLRSHSRKNILTVLVDGEPFDVIPSALLFEEKEEIKENGEAILVRHDVEPLSADYRNGIKKARKTELPRLAAGLIGCSYEELMRRRQQHRNRVIAAAVICILAMITIAGTYIIRTSMRIQDNYQKALYNQSEYLSGESIRVKSEENNRELATQLALSAVPDAGNDMPYNPHAQFALFHAVNPYRLPDEEEFVGIRSYEGKQGDIFYDMDYMEERGFLAAIDSHQLYLWNADRGELINKDSFDQNIYNGSVKFSDSYLWVVSGSMVKVYPLDDPSKGRILDTGTYIYSQKPVFDEKYLYLLAQTQEEILEDNENWYLYIIDLNSAEIKSEISLNKTIQDKTEVKDIKVSSDDSYCCIVVNSSKDNDTDSYKKSDELVIIDLPRGKSYKQKIFKENETNKYIDNMCFFQQKLVLSCYSMPTDEDGNMQVDPDRKNIGTYYYNNHRIICYDIDEDRYIWNLEGFGNKGDGPAQIQYYYLKEENSGKYQKVIVAAFSNHVMIINAKNGSILQEEYMPYGNLTLIGSSYNKKSDGIGLYCQEAQKFLKLLYEDNDSEIRYKDILTIDRADIKAIWGHLSESDDMFICYPDEIRQSKKGISNTAHEWIDMEESHGSSWNQVSFDKYLVILTTSTIDLYDLKKKSLLDSQPFDVGSGTIMDVVDDKVIIQDPVKPSVFYSYDVKKKNVKTIELSLEKGEDSWNEIVGSAIRDHSLVVFFTTFDYEATQGDMILHTAVCDLSEAEDFVIDDGIRMDSFIGDVYPDEEGKYAYINSTSKDTIELVDLESGKTIICEGNFSDYHRFFWHDNYLIAYDKEGIEVLDSSKGSKILSIEGEDIVNCGMNDNMLYYLTDNGRIYRVSLADKKEKVTLFTKYNEYMDFNLQEAYFQNGESESWFFDDEIIRVVQGPTVLELDKNTLELIGYCDDVLYYAKDMNYYCVQDYDNNRIGLFQSYSLKDLIKMGKKIVDGRDMSEKNKMKYGLE